MLTRKNTRIELDDIDDEEWERIISRTPEEEAADDAEFEREQDTWIREHNEALRRMTTLQRYRYERHHVLISILRTRVRIDSYMTYGLDFLVVKQRAYLAKRQSDLLGWRNFLKTGIEPVQLVN